MRNSIIIATSIVGLVITYMIFYYTSVESVSIVVQDKEVVTQGNGQSVQSKYLVFTEGEGFYKNDY